MGASPDVLRRVAEFRQALEGLFHPVTHVLLFGSQARGDMHEDSDTDIIVVSPAFRGMNALRRMSEARRAWPAHLPVDIICYTPEEFAELSTRFSLVSEALREGIEVEA